MYLSDRNITLNKCTCQTRILQWMETRILQWINVLIRREYYNK
jgi:hypothetical protein